MSKFSPLNPMSALNAVVERALAHEKKMAEDQTDKALEQRAVDLANLANALAPPDPASAGRAADLLREKMLQDQAKRLSERDRVDRENYQRSISAPIGPPSIWPRPGVSGGPLAGVFPSRVVFDDVTDTKIADLRLEVARLEKTTQDLVEQNRKLHDLVESLIPHIMNQRRKEKKGSRARP